LEILFTNERRLLSIETELETARQIQSSILPARVPELENLRIAASYHPMTAVAGDFYQFVRSDNNHLGILVADVSGHGIPAALISTMIKVAMQSVAVHADDPAQVLSGLNRILWSEAHGQFGSTHRTATHSTRLLDIHRYCAGGIRGAKCSISKVTGCCSESNLTLSTRCAACRLNHPIASCSTPTA
jgi:hypothetical protein